MPPVHSQPARKVRSRPPLVLASASPRRRELLRSLELEFELRPVDLDETPLPDEPADRYVTRLAAEKAAAAAAAGDGRRELVLAADTTVVLDGELLGKPADAAEARWMLARIAGREHQVHTGVALLDAGRSDSSPLVEQVTSRVRMALLGAEDIAWYVATGEPMDKAGAYAVQGLGALFVEEIDGNYTNVVGLPLPTVLRLFARAGYDLRSFRPR
jgi:septum formation protein